MYKGPIVRLGAQQVFSGGACVLISCSTANSFCSYQEGGKEQLGELYKHGWCFNTAQCILEAQETANSHSRNSMPVVGGDKDMVCVRRSPLSHWNAASCTHCLMIDLLFSSPQETFGNGVDMVIQFLKLKILKERRVFCLYLEKLFPRGQGKPH